MHTIFYRYKNVVLVFLKNLFFLSSVLLLLDIFTPVFIDRYISINVLIFLIFFCFFSILFIYIREDKIHYKKKLEPLFKYLFLFFLLLVAISSLDFEIVKQFEFSKIVIEFLKIYSYLLNLLAIGFGFFTFYFNKERIEQETKEEEKKEEFLEEKRRREFPEKFKTINKIPVLRNIFRWVYKEGWGYVLVLLLILTMFTVVKYPYFEVSFTGEHSMKYNAYVEPAKHMYKNKNPFWLQKKYEADPIENPEGTRDSYGSPLFHEWGLLITYLTFPNNSIEFNTRLYTHFLGILILILSYNLITKWFTRSKSLIAVFLIAINPIINFLSFVTVEDSLLVIFTLLTLIFLTRHLQNSKASTLFFTGIFFGLANISKISVFLWLFPIVFIILFFKTEKFNTFLTKISVITFLSLISIVSFQSSLRYLPREVLISSLKFLIWIGIFVIVYILLKNYQKLLDNLFEYILKNKIIFLIIILIGSILFIEQFLKISGFFYYFDEHITDFQLILNWDMYKFLIDNQIRNYVTPSIYYLGLIGFLTLATNIRRNILIFSMFTGSLLFLILASKVIFFHSYYTGIIMLTFALSASAILHKLLSLFPKKVHKFIVIIILLTFIFPSSYRANTKRLSREMDIVALQEVAYYLEENMDINDFYIDESYLVTLTIMTDRPRTTAQELVHDEIKESIKRIGFKETLKSNKVAFLVTSNHNPNYLNYAELFTEESLEKPPERSRTKIILQRLGQDHTLYTEAQGKREKIVKKENIEDKFLLVKEAGPFKIYDFKD
jgi:4-amino-4-deoxy-L-arabinose transferase-like glycosyltransferase